jgi:hypothetical protein
MARGAQALDFGLRLTWLGQIAPVPVPMHANSLKPSSVSGTMPLVDGAPRKRVPFVDDQATILEGLAL